MDVVVKFVTQLKKMRVWVCCCHYLHLSHLPVLFFHLSVQNETLHLLFFTIFQTHPGTNVTTVDMYDDMASLKPLWEQVNGFRKVIGPIMENAKDGIHLICFSQGLLLPPLHHLYFLTFLSCLVTIFTQCPCWSIKSLLHIIHMTIFYDLKALISVKYS